MPKRPKIYFILFYFWGLNTRHFYVTEQYLLNVFRFMLNIFDYLNYVFIII